MSNQPPAVTELPGFTENLNRLFEAYRWVDDGAVLKYRTATELATRIRALGYRCSAGYMYQMQSGKKRNPTAVLLAGISEAFGGIDVRFWYDEEVRVQVLRDLDRRREGLEGAP